MRQKTQKIMFISVYTVLFSGLIFIWKELIFPSHVYEEKYVEPVLSLWHKDSESDNFLSFDRVSQEGLDTTIKKLIYEKYSKEYSQKEQNKVYFRYIPSSLYEDIQYSYLPIAEVFLFHKKIISRIQDMWILLYKNRGNTRGRMKGGDIHIYNPESMTDSEFLWVLIHEFWHYYDIHSLEWNAFGDISQNFYDISWKSVTTTKPDMTRKDFVSGYSMTNQYEDFAETYLYFILHNEDFAFKSISNTILQKKYDFMRSYITWSWDFTLQSFSDDDVQSYYWDITKIPVDVKKFLQYLQEDI